MARVNHVPVTHTLNQFRRTPHRLDEMYEPQLSPHLGVGHPSEAPHQCQTPHQESVMTPGGRTPVSEGNGI